MVSANIRVLTGLEILEEADRLNAQASEAIESGDYETAEKLLQRALCIKESELGCNHPVVAADIYNVALVCQSLGNYSEAFALLRRALLIEQATLGLDHYTVQETQNALAELLEEIDEFAYLDSPFTAEYIVKGA